MDFLDYLQAAARHANEQQADAIAATEFAMGQRPPEDWHTHRVGWLWQDASTMREAAEDMRIWSEALVAVADITEAHGPLRN
jgi:hypothetical protein